MILGSSHVSSWIGDYDIIPTNENKSMENSHSSIDISSLVYYFFFLYFLMATQDIAVDGWALTMLSRESVGYASLCNSIGQSLGVFLANQGYIALSDPIWCQQFLGFTSSQPILTLDKFMRFWGYVFIAVTFIVLIGKSEEDIVVANNPINNNSTSSVIIATTHIRGRKARRSSDNLEDCESNALKSNSDVSNFASTDEPAGLYETCHQLYSIGQLPLIHTLMAVLLTCKMAFAAADAVSNYKLQEYGMPKTELSMISPILVGVGFVVPLVAGRAMSESPLKVLLSGVKLKLFTSMLRWVTVQLCFYVYSYDNVSSRRVFFFLLVLTMVLHDAAGSLIFVSLMTFFSKVSDARIGGTYMTFLNTANNLGSIWPSSLALWLLPKFNLQIGIINFALHHSEPHNRALI
jgi:PAT family acetyl-CoA transporter-like MFS transporter 1